MFTIGVLAIQGSVIEHAVALEKAAKRLRILIEVVEVRTIGDICDSKGNVLIDGIILPGGESTAQSLLLGSTGLFEVLKKAIEDGLSVWGTCAGAILLAKKVTGKNPPRTLEVMDIVADRNAYGSQLDSFDESIMLKFPGEKERTMRPAFIRAPKLKPLKKEVRVIAKLNGKPVGFLQKHMLATAFHPELTRDSILHEFFIRMCLEK